jgi:hypothetical protein
MESWHGWLQPNPSNHAWSPRLLLSPLIESSTNLIQLPLAKSTGETSTNLARGTILAHPYISSLPFLLSLFTRRVSRSNSRFIYLQVKIIKRQIENKNPRKFWFQKKRILENSHGYIYAATSVSYATDIMNGASTNWDRPKLVVFCFKRPNDFSRSPQIVTPLPRLTWKMHGLTRC